jgi:surface antigen
MKKLVILTALISLSAISCAPQYGPARTPGMTTQNGVAGTGITKQNIGMVAGALGGAFAAKDIGKGKGNVLAIAGGTLLGGLIGSEIGASLDRADMQYLNSTTQNALEQTGTGTTSTWQNPDSGHAGSITPTRTYQTAGGQYCREFTQVVNIGTEKANAVGTACRQPDGTWRITN